MKNISMYSMSEELARIKEYVEHQPEALTDEDLKAIEELEGDLKSDMNAKAEGYCLLINDWLLSASVLDQEIKRLTARKKKLKSDAERLKTYAGNSLELAGLDKAGGDFGSLHLRRGRMSVSIVDESAIPERFIKVQKSFDKSGINAEMSKFMKADLSPEEMKEAESYKNALIPGAQLVRGQNTVQVK